MLLTLELGQFAVRVVRDTNDARADAADVEAANARVEEAVGNPDRVLARARRALERLDVAAFAMERDDPAAEAVVLRRKGLRAQILHVAAKARKVLREGELLPARRVNAVRIVVDRRNADQ